MTFHPAQPAIVLVAGLLATVDVTQGLQAVTVLIGLAAALAVGRAKRKDAIIADLEKSEARLEKALEGAAARADREHERRRELESECATWRGKYEEQAKYTAREALEAVAHELGGIRGAFESGMASHGELILKANELVAAASSSLERVTVELERVRGEVRENREVLGRRLDDLDD